MALPLPQSDLDEEFVQYLVSNNVPVLFNEIVLHLVSTKPSEPVPAILDFLEKKCGIRKGPLKGVLRIVLVGANGLPQLPGKKCDPYVRFKLCGTTAQSGEQPNTQYPVWNQRFVMDVKDCLTDELSVEVWGEGRAEDGARAIGKCMVPLAHIPTNATTKAVQWPLATAVAGTEDSWLEPTTVKVSITPVNFDIADAPKSITIRLMGATNVPNDPTTKTCQPQVRFKLAKFTAQSSRGKGNNFQFDEKFLMDVNDVKSDTLKIELWAAERFEADGPVGECDLQINDIVHDETEYHLPLITTQCPNPASVALVLTLDGGDEE